MATGSLIIRFSTVSQVGPPELWLEKFERMRAALGLRAGTIQDDGNRVLFVSECVADQLLAAAAANDD